MPARRALLVALASWPGAAMAALFGSLFAGTPPADLGARDGRLAPCPAKPNCVSSQSADETHRIAPFPLRGPPLSSMAALARIVAAQPGATIVVQRDDYLYATFATALMGFVDDVEFVVDAPRGLIDVRSASRLGYGDLGVNRKRVEALRAAYAEGAA
jgi:uncharacterized protein (DUF1499 family)